MNLIPAEEKVCVCADLSGQLRPGINHILAFIIECHRYRLAGTDMWQHVEQVVLWSAPPFTQNQGG